MSKETRRVNQQSRINDPGFGEKIGARSNRLVNKDGTFNVKRKGEASGLRVLYQSLVEASHLHFFFTILFSYIGSNLIFGTIYWFIGPDKLIGIRTQEPLQHALDCFFFSAQTFTTVGYGAIAPKGALASSIASIEAFLGLLFFALATGLFYARFSRPRAQLLFSNNALVAPFKEGEGLMFRLVNERKNVLIDMHARVILMIRNAEDSSADRGYYQLDLHLSTIMFVPMSWTVVHPITESSPLYNLTVEDMRKRDAEIIIMISAFDDTFHQTVHSRYSYTAEEFIPKAKFIRAFGVNEQGEVEMNIGKIHDYEQLES